MTGAVLAGGLGRRMGGDKALLPWEGGRLWERQVAVLKSIGARPVAVVRRPGQSELGSPCWRDQRTDAGPLAGLEVALALSPGADEVAVLAVDMPWIDAGWFEWLLGHRTLSRGLIAQHPDAFEPLAAVYPTAALPAIKERLERGDYALQPLIRSLIAQGHLTAVPLPPERRAAALSVNLPTQLG